MNLVYKHIPVMVTESISGLITSDNGVYVDGTFGRGGHASAILGKLSSKGKLIAIDKDPSASKEATKLRDKRLFFVSGCFSQLKKILSRHGISSVDGIFVDLGVSSPQLEDSSRGFSFNLDGPLDMRMDNSSGETVADWLEKAEEKAIAKVLRSYGQERFAKRVAKAIVFNRAKEPIKTTFDLVSIVKKSVLVPTKNKHPATKVFQALRIHINKELDSLRSFLPQCVQSLKPGGRLVVISFHSLEDRIVKQFFKAESEPPYVPKEIPIKGKDLPEPRIKIIGKALFPKEMEISNNPRSRSAVLRIGERLAA